MDLCRDRFTIPRDVQGAAAGSQRFCGMHTTASYFCPAASWNVTSAVTHSALARFPEYIVSSVNPSSSVWLSVSLITVTKKNPLPSQPLNLSLAVQCKHQIENTVIHTIACLSNRGHLSFTNTPHGLHMRSGLQRHV